jgi:hypothetical protein
MAYTNGFNSEVILPALKGRIGWRSASGVVRNFEEFHALCTEQNLRDVQPNATITNDEWEIEKGKIEDGIINRCLSSVFSKPEYQEQVLLHRRWHGSVNQLIENSDLFVGIRIGIAPDFGITSVIKTVTLLFDSNVTFHLYLYQDGNPEPIGDVEVSAEANKPTVFDVDDLFLSYADTQSTVFYFGYFQNDLGSAKAIRQQVSWNVAKCFAARSFSMKRSEVPNFLPSYSYDAYGINAEMHSFKDYTAKIKRSAHLFDEVIGLSMVAYVIEQILATTRSNSTDRILKGGIEKISLQHYLYGSVPAMGVAKTTGLNEMIQAKFEEVRNSFDPKPKAMTVSVC